MTASITCPASLLGIALGLKDLIKSTRRGSCSRPTTKMIIPTIRSSDITPP